MLIAVSELSAASGGIILIIMLLLITAAVFSIKFALDIALSKKLSSNETNDEKKYIYAVKNDTNKNRTQRKAPKYTIIPENKLFILENPVSKDKNR